MPEAPKISAGGPLYKTAYYLTRYLNVPPNLHRLYNAAGLMAGIVVGRKLMDIAAGQKIDGTPVDKEDVPLPLKPLHGVLAYDHFSDDPKHRWMKIFDQIVPAALGGLGAAAGSVFFFRKDFFHEIDKRMALPAKDFTLSEAEHRSLYHISKPWGLISGLSAVFGSASGFGLFPSPVNYSSTLGTTFSIRAGRTMAAPWWRKMWNSHTQYPFRPTKLINRMVDYIAANPEAHPERLESYAVGILKTWFKGAEEKHIKAFVDEILAQRNQFLKEGRLPEEAEAKVRESMKQLFGNLQAHPGMENLLIKIGLDPRQAAIGDMGIVSTIAHWFGDALGFRTSRKIAATRKLMQEGMELRHPELKKIPFTPQAPHYSDTTGKKIAAGAFVGVGAATAYSISTARDTWLCDLDAGSYASPADATQKTPAASERQGTSHAHKVHSKRQHGFVNGRVLDAAEGVTGMFSAGIGTHRLHCAAGLTVGSWLGDKIMEALTGATFQGAKVPKEKVWKPLRKLYKILPYEPKSDLPHDKWMQILRWAVPAALGGMAVIQGSKMFFADRHRQLKGAKYLDEVEDKATEKQSNSWGATSAVTALFGYPSGLPMLPFLNYSTHLGTRYSMASGRKVSLPVIGKLWSNNSTLFPFGPPGMLNLLIKEAVNNKRFDPELLETYAIGVLKPWFKNVTPEQVTEFVMKVHEIRDKFFKEGGVPEDLKAQLEKELTAHFRGAGLEETLEHIGLDPAKAEIASNGWSGAIANRLGAKKTIEKIKADYVAGYRARHAKREESPDPKGLSH